MTPIAAPFRVWQSLRAPVQLLVYGLAVYATGLASVRWFRPEGTNLAIWWPVAGLGLIAMLLATHRQRAWVLGAHLLATSAINATGGMAVTTSLLLGSANAAELGLVMLLLSRGRPDPRRMHDPQDFGRLVLATVAGAVFIGLAAGLIIHGPHLDLLAGTVQSLVPSHASALLLFAILPSRGLPSLSEAPRLELVAQWVLVAAVTSAVFAPGQRSPLVFLIVPAVLWAALRSGVRAVGLQLVTVAGIAATLTLRGGGPFAANPAGPVVEISGSVALVQVFTFSVTVVIMSTFLTVQGRREAAAEVALRDHRAQLVHEQGLTGVVDLQVFEGGLRIVAINRIASRFLEASPRELIGRSWCERFAAADRAQLRAGVRALLAGERAAWHGELHATIDGDDRWFEVALFPTPADPGQPQFTAQMLDVTARRATEMRLTDLALRDDLTGAANRPLLLDRLSVALAGADRQGHVVGLLYLDLDGFKPINDRFGHRAGDEVLIETVRRLRHHVRAADTVARLGGDEFAVLLADLDDETAAEATAERIRDALRAPLQLGTREVTVGASVGVATSVGTEDPDELLHRADLAMYAEKPYAMAALVPQA
jgi:diguanylate cyclase (GGDEF)-like protein/PAS domain S-box-containing protein